MEIIRQSCFQPSFRQLWALNFRPTHAYPPRVSEPAPSAITPNTRFCAVFGHPVRHSASPALHNPAIASLGLDWRYLACDVPPDDLAAAIAGARVMKFIGLNLTVPHKLLAVDMCDELDETAKTWGAVNTIRFEGQDAAGVWRPLAKLPQDYTGTVRSHGFNTDADAIIRALGEDLGFTAKDAKVVLLGAGGAGRVAALRLAAEGVKTLCLVNRTASKAQELAVEITARFPGVEAKVGYPADQTCDLLLNATSLGLKPADGLPLDTSALPLAAASRVYDMIYRPAETPLLKAAREAGCRTANGLGMLLYQGAKALELWSNREAPVPLMRQALHAHIYG